MSDWIKDMNRCTGPDGKRDTEAHKQEPESPLLDTRARFEIFCRYCGAPENARQKLADAIPREIHDRLITAVREIYELLAINTADSINAAYLRAKEECEKCS
jgi:hypothetical protein